MTGATRSISFLDGVINSVLLVIGELALRLTEEHFWMKMRVVHHYGPQTSTSLFPILMEEEEAEGGKSSTFHPAA